MRTPPVSQSIDFNQFMEHYNLRQDYKSREHSFCLSQKCY